MKKYVWPGMLFLVTAVCSCGSGGNGTAVYDLLPERTFDVPGMEGPACDREGNLYAVSYGRKGTIGRVRPDGTHELFVDLKTVGDSAVANGIRFGKDGFMYVAEYKLHNILRIDPVSRRIEVFAHEPAMNQPNDIALSPEGRLYASDPNWKEGTGQLWLVDRDGTVSLLESGMGTTNGVEVSPDGRTLYVNESAQRRIWKYRIRPDGRLADKALFYRFGDHGMDGMRCDVKGNLYAARHGKGTVLVLSPEGKEIREIRLKGKLPSNLTFGGPENRRCYVTLADRGCFEYFDAPYPGRE